MLVFDIETKTFGRPDPTRDELRFFGAYDMNTEEYYYYDWKQTKEIEELLKKHKVIVSFNGMWYDEPILRRAINWNFRNTHIDLYQIADKRSVVLGIKNISKSLENLAKHWKLPVQKGDIDYNLFKKDNFTKEELDEIWIYLKGDLQTTTELFKHLYKFFEPFKEFLGTYDKAHYKWLTTSIAVYAYKVICNMAGLREEYADVIDRPDYEGGYVADPSVDEEHGNIYCWDFNSLYPHNYIQGNLYSPSETGWSGNDLFPVIGTYDNTKQGKIEKVIQQIYNLRKKYKAEGNSLEFALKIVINTLYGLTGNPVFKSLYNYKAASDCTLIGRESVKLARRKFAEAGYKVLYTDTDSVYIKDPFDNIDKMTSVKDLIVAEIKDNLPFPTSTFDMGMDEKIEHIWFFGKKKHYIYVNTKGKVTIKGMPFIKSDSSGVGYYIVKKYFMESMKNGTLKHDYNKYKPIIFDEIEKNLDLVARDFKVMEVNVYKNPSQIQAQIAEKYGPGKHKLIPNKYVGVGKGVKYCKVEEFRKENLSVHAIVLNKMWNELSVFLNYTPQQFKARKYTGQEELARWMDT